MVTEVTDQNGVTEFRSMKIEKFSEIAILNFADLLPELPRVSGVREGGGTPLPLMF